MLENRALGNNKNESQFAYIEINLFNEIYDELAQKSKHLNFI